MPVSESMKEHLQGNTSLSVFLTITARDGDTLRVWNGTRNKTIGGNVFYAYPVAPSRLQTKNGLTADNFEITAVYSGLFTAATMRAKKWMGARVVYETRDYRLPELGYAERRVTYIGQTEAGRFAAKTELKSLGNKLSQPVGRTYQALCDVVELGDARCGVDLDDNTADGYRIKSTGTVAAPVLNRQQFSVLFDSPIYQGIPGLRGKYYAGNNFENFIFERTDAAVNFEYGAAAPDARLPADNFSIRWEGTVTPQFSETYTFSVEHDDGIRLWVDNLTTPLIDSWTVNGTHTGNIALTADVPVQIRLDFRDHVSVAKVILRWSSASLPLEVIPQSRLLAPPPAGGTSTAPDDLFERGKIKFLTGANAGAEMLILTNAANDVTLYLPLFYTPQVGDQIEVITGCNRKIAVCRDRYANALRNRSVYMLPGRSKVLAFPQ